MSMPNDLVLIRHGESEGNVVVNASKAGDNTLYTDKFMTTPGHQWRLTDKGRSQAAAAGAWVRANVTERFDKMMSSPYVRTRETAGSLELPEAQWMLNRALRERDWGDIGSLPRSEFESMEQYKWNSWLKKHDPLYWVAPGGESIAHVAEDRVRNVLDTLHRECSGQKVVCVTHGEAIQAFCLVLERMSDEAFKAWEKSIHIHNCETFWFTRNDPETGEQAPRLTWLKQAWPVFADGAWAMDELPWRKLEFRTYSNEELLAQVAEVPQLLTPPPAVEQLIPG